MAGASSSSLPRYLPPPRRPADGSRAAAMAQVGDSVPPMDIDEFYEADPRRRASAELELGSEWLGKDGVQHELNYVEDTGELYVLREPQPHERADPFGGIHITDPPGYENKITVHVIAKIPTVDDLHRILEGWQVAMREEGNQGTHWLGQHLMAAGVAVGPTGDPISDS
jgi:hypothetical protein